MKNRNIDIIIPVYNVEKEILFRCLSSIACQDILDELLVTIVDDASDLKYVKIYDDVVKRFKGTLKIKVLRYKTNGGPGVARQYGLDNTHNDYFMFVDADDTLNGSFTCKILRYALEDNGEKNILSVGVFDEVREHDIPINRSPLYIPHEKDLIWVFGKLYRRSFINKYNIRFHPTSRANEDNGFNTIIRLLSNANEIIRFIPVHVYYWHENLNSITRANEYQYTCGTSKEDSFYGYIENMIYATKKAKDMGASEYNLRSWTVDCITFLYKYYLETIESNKDHASCFMDYCKLFYNEIYKLYEKDITVQMLSESYTELIRNSFQERTVMGIIPSMTLFDFLNKIKE
jgi:glycosyltransferase involved in cell wall biosynthesis